MLGRGVGRQTKHPVILGVRELAKEEVVNVKRMRYAGPKALREVHHRVARLFAMGLRQTEIRELTGYAANRISMLYNAPTFRALVESYKADVTEEWKDEVRGYYAEADRIRTAALRMMAEQLDNAAETGEQVPMGTLLKIHDSLADRTGYPKRKESVNLNIDFASKLERAMQRSSKVIELDSVRQVGGAVDRRVDKPDLPPAPRPDRPGAAELARSLASLVHDPAEAEGGPAAPGLDAGRARVLVPNKVLRRV